MAEKLVIVVIGNRRSGKSETWRRLFRKTVRSGEKKLPFNRKEYVDVRLVGSSPQEQETTIEKILGRKRPRIVLCAIQYSEDTHNTLNFFAKNRYTIVAHWLNPGYKDKYPQILDEHGIIARLLSFDSLVGIRNGKKSAGRRSENLRDFVYGWASRRRLVKIN